FVCSLLSSFSSLFFLYYVSSFALSGIHCRITTVSDVPVKAGESVSIPCLYEAQYRDDVKYLCKGYRWAFCKTVIRTDQEPCSGRFCISDDKEQRIFTVTIKNITDEDSYFWCAVEISGPDVKKYFQLSLTTGTPSLFVSQKEIAGPQGGSVTVLCHYNYPKVPQWCRLGSSCATDEIGSIDGTTVKINASVPDVLNVSMIELRTESSGWYWCAEGGFQMPVHVTVSQNPDTDVSYATIVRNEHAGAETKVETVTQKIYICFIFYILTITLTVYLAQQDCIPTESVTYSTVVRTSNMQQMVHN
uniref:Immunoglobulin domain-containing protein n=1 Tax=Stegastes partitus TaxID=144197 RepID=A0A3B4ZWF7_9TELE